MGQLAQRSHIILVRSLLYLFRILLFMFLVGTPRSSAFTKVIAVSHSSPRCWASYTPLPQISRRFLIRGLSTALSSATRYMTRL